MALRVETSSIRALDCSTENISTPDRVSIGIQLRNPLSTTSVVTAMTPTSITVQTSYSDTSETELGFVDVPAAPSDAMGAFACAWLIHPVIYAASYNNPPWIILGVFGGTSRRSVLGEVCRTQTAIRGEPTHVTVFALSATPSHRLTKHRTVYSPDKSALPLGPSTSTLTLCVNGSMTVAIIHITQSSPADKTAQLEVERVLDHAASASTRKFVPAGYSHPLSRQLFKMMSRLDGGDEESTRKRVRRPFVRVLYMCDPDSKPQVLHVSNAALRFASKAQDASSCSRSAHSLGSDAHTAVARSCITAISTSIDGGSVASMSSPFRYSPEGECSEEPPALLHQRTLQPKALNVCTACASKQHDLDLLRDEVVRLRETVKAQDVALADVCKRLRDDGTAVHPSPSNATKSILSEVDALLLM